MPNLSLNFDNMNVSAQVGDIVYYSHSGLNTGGFDNTALPNTRMLGDIISIVDNGPGLGWTIVVNHFSSAPPPTGLGGEYISFAKDKRFNTSSLVGYYANVKFVNNSTNKVELFAVGSETSESSK
tara:strand:+ start:710 stop:1084 length:375 start_codon:yes stop_codon:yes gene_type:complete